MNRVFSITLILIFVISGLAAQTPTKKVALIIGAQNYTTLPRLRNSLNDARAMSAKLKTKGFQVEVLYDPKTKGEVRDAITRYYNIMSNQSGGVGLIFYAGHGMQYDGDNYIIPTSASLQNPGDLDDQCVKINTVMAVMKSSGKSLNILILDACRSLTSFTRSTEQGLSRMEAPQGSIIVFAAQQGKVASDGTGQNGLFTSKLMKALDEPNLNITDVFKKVKREVYAESNETQLPSVEDNSVGGDFYFTKEGNQPRPANTNNKNLIDTELNKEDPALEKSIAILPFINISSDPEQEYFSDGMTEQIISNLSGLRDLKVIARTSVMKFKGSSKSIEEISRELNVDKILEGSVRKYGDKIRITVKLINVSDQTQLWAKNYDEKLLADVFAIQDNVAAEIVKAMKAQMLPGKTSVATLEKKINLAAYDLYLKGNYYGNLFWAGFKLDNFIKAEELYKSALAIDSLYAEAYLGLANIYDGYLLSKVYQFSSKSEQEEKYRNKLDSCANKAYRLNPDFPPAILAKAFTFFKYPNGKSNFDSGLYYLRKGYRANPNDADANFWVGRFYNILGLYYQARPYLEKCRQLDPIGTSAYNAIVFNYISVGEINQAEKYNNEGLQFNPNEGILNMNVFGIAIDRRDRKKASDSYENLTKMDEAADWMRAELFAINGQKEEALKLDKRSYVYLLLGMNKEALAGIKKNFKQFAYLRLLHNQIFDPLRADPEFIGLLNESKKLYDDKFEKYASDLP
jgi:TolB-like protein